MKLISWNVNGLRACIGKGFLDTFGELDADIFCIQETKMQQGQIDFEVPGYTQYWNSAEKKGYSGTAVFARQPAAAACYGIGIPEHDQEGRVITLEFDGFYLVNVYTPNSQRGLLRLEYRMQWEDAFLHHVRALDCEKPVIICGDLNVAHKEIDLRNPGPNKKNAGFTPEERQKMTDFLAAGFADTFRERNPDLAGAYSWWSYMGNARKNNTGWRIDYFLVSRRAMPQVQDAMIYPDYYGSDHCPIGLEIAL